MKPCSLARRTSWRMALLVDGPQVVREGGDGAVDRPDELLAGPLTGLGAGVGGHAGVPFDRRVEPAAWMAVYGAPAPSHDEVLHLQVLVDAVDGALPPEAGLLDAAERGDLVGDVAGVDPDHARLERGGDPPDALGVAGEQVGGETELGVVGHAGRVGLVGEPDEREHGPEGLLPGDVHAGGDVGEHGRLEELPAPLVARPAAQHPCAVAGGVGDVLLDLGDRGRVDQRADLAARLEPVADGELGDPRRPAPRRSGRRCRPARTRGWRRCRTGRCCGTSRVSTPATATSRSASSKTRIGALPPSSIDVFLIVCAPTAASSSRPTSVEPVKVTLRTSGLPVSSAPISRALADHHVEDAGRHARAVGELGERQRRQRGLRGRLDHHRASGGQRRSGLAGDHRGREVPRRDGGADPDRLLEDHDAPGGVGRREHVAAHPLGLLGEPFEERRRVGHLAARLGERLALLERDDPGEIVGVLDDQVEPPAQHAGPVLGRPRPPAGPGAVGRGDGLGGLGAAQRREVGDRLPGRGVVDAEAAGRRRRRPSCPSTYAESRSSASSRRPRGGHGRDAHRALTSGPAGCGWGGSRRGRLASALPTHIAATARSWTAEPTDLYRTICSAPVRPVTRPPHEIGQ